MTPKDAIEILENASKLSKDIGAKGMAENLREVIKVIQELENDITRRDIEITLRDSKPRWQ